jgi:inner membrane protein
MKIEITNQGGRWYQSLTIKLILLAFMGLVFMIPLEMVKSVIMERQKNAGDVRMEISKQWAEKQCISGPVLNIPVRSVPVEKDEKPVNMVWHILPESLKIDGVINPEIRYRGIYQSVVYGSDLQISGDFILPENLTVEGYTVFPDNAYFTVGFSDNRGLKGDVALFAGTSEIHAEPGVKDQDLFTSGVTFNYPVSGSGSKIEFRMNLKLSGSEGILITPLGKTTNAHLSSSWPSPSFNGSFLPAARNVTDKGFSADWEVTHLNRNFPQSWKGNAYQTAESSFGLDLFMPVDHYQKSWRSARYGILFIALTFLVLVFLEITRKENLHIFHYFLVSLGLVLFFSLLNSLSEQIGFNLAYLVSSAATVIMITLFTGALFRDKKTAFIVLGMLSVLYVFIYVLLTLNDYAYLAGNIGLFILLAIIMRLAARMKIFKGEPEEN